MLNKPFILTLLLIAVSMGIGVVVGLIFTTLGFKSNSGIGAVIAIFAAQYVGQIYANKYQIELPKSHKIKIVVYYFLIQVLSAIGLLLLILHSNKLLAPMITLSLFLSLIISLFIYPSLGRGCRTKLKQLEKKGSLNSQLDPQT